MNSSNIRFLEQPHGRVGQVNDVDGCPGVLYPDHVAVGERLIAGAADQCDALAAEEGLDNDLGRGIGRHLDPIVHVELDDDHSTVDLECRHAAGLETRDRHLVPWLDPRGIAEVRFDRVGLGEGSARHQQGQGGTAQHEPRRDQADDELVALEEGAPVAPEEPHWRAPPSRAKRRIDPMPSEIGVTYLPSSPSPASDWSSPCSSSG
jgi:hypothetical protein